MKKKIDGNFGLFLLFLRKYSLVKVIFAWQFFTRYDSKIWPDFIQLHRKWPENCRTFISSFIIYLKTWIYLVTVHFYISWMHYYSQLSIAFQFSSFFSVSDFTHSLAKLQEQYADDLHHLVDEFRHKNNELRAER